MKIVFVQNYLVLDFSYYLIFQKETGVHDVSGTGSVSVCR
jgi:hypothetical protein